MSQNTNFESHTTNWKTEPILNLADHFHLLVSAEGQQKRLTEYAMDSSADLALFNTIVRSNSISRIEMHLGLDGAANSTGFTSCFHIKLYHGNGEMTYFKLKAAHNPPPDQENEAPYSDIVPPIFKQMIAKNWAEIDNHLIDDLFVATNESVLERVHYFLIGDKMRDYIRDLLADCPIGNDIQEIKIYAGVDLNKFSDKTTISFTPVLGLRLPEPALPLVEKGGNVNCLKGEVLIEYSMPCPPVCKPIEENC